MQKITYRLADESDILDVAKFHNTFFEEGRNQFKMNWLWNQNPAGKAICVLALDRQRIVGTQCVLPYWFRDRFGERILTGKSDDTCVHPEYRKKGIFRTMYDYLIREAQSQNVQVIWGFTSATVPFKNIGFEIGDPYSMAFFGSVYMDAFRELSQGLGFLGKLKTGGFLTKMFFRKGGNQVSIRRESFSEILPEILVLERQQEYSIEISEQYLRWRILKNPYYHTVHTLTYRQSELLVAYVVFHIVGQTAYVIHDCCHPKQSAEMKAKIIASLSKEMIGLGAAVIKNWLFEGCYKAQIRKASFTEAGYLHKKTGSHFVWLPLKKTLSVDWKDLYLSRIASLGTR